MGGDNSEISLLELEGDWYAKALTLEEKHGMPVVLNVKRAEPTGMIEVGRFSRDSFNPAALRLPPDSSGKLIVRYFAGSKIVGNMTIYVDPTQRPPAPAPVPAYATARPTAEPTPAPASESVVVQTLLEELREMRRAMMDSATRRPEVAAGGLTLEQIRELIAPRSQLRELAEQVGMMRELGLVGSSAEEPWKGKLIDALAAPVANVVVELLKAEASGKKPSSGAQAPAAQLPSKPAAASETAQAEASPAPASVPEVADVLELPGGLKVPVSDELRELGRLVRSVVGLKLNEEGAASVIAAAFDARTTDTESPWAMLEQFESPGALAGMIASLLPDLKDRTEYFLRVETQLREIAAQAEEVSA